jgi:REP element-mobilizing transposase RayT
MIETRGSSPTVREGVLSSSINFHRSMRDFDDNEFPLAYLITLRTYGTWLHGDERGSMDRKNNVYGTSKVAPNSLLKKSDAKQLKHPPITLNTRQRLVVGRAIREVCDHRPYVLRAINVRTNHVHTVVTAMQDPERVLDAFKAYATRALRRSRLLTVKIKPWGRHGSTVYLWKEKDVAKAIEYVMLGQGDDLFRLDDDE